jgi:phenylalanyl-tRNA synthetase beta chain
MKFTLSWLKEHLDTQASLDEIVETLTRIGLEVEGLDDPAARLKDFLIASVVEAVQHPNADKLRVCQVDAGAGALVQVVCGAPNARAGMKSVFSPPGTYIPGKNVTLGKGVIRGVESNGMLCSAAELELSNDHDGIIDLPADAPVGARYVDWAGLSDPVIEINLTPNRPDAAGVRGIARDLAAAGLGTLKPLDLSPVKGLFPCPTGVTLDLPPAEAHLAPAFALRLVRGVKNGPAPEWMQKRLRAIGLRPISALVDVTNYVTFDIGRPLHVFDADKVKGALVVRKAREGDELLALDGKTYRPQAPTLVISDDNGVESLAGIMGGEHSGCSETTTNVLIESALWDPANTAASGRKHGVVTDARYRFERGVDPAMNTPGVEIATRLVMAMCGGEPSETIVAGEVPKPDKRVDLPWSETRRLTGLEIAPAQQAATLQKLGFEILAQDDAKASVRVPSWRPDVEGKADLVEEIARIAGFDAIRPAALERDEKTVLKPVLTLLQRRTRAAKRALAARGLVEAVTWSFVSKDEASLFGGGKPELALANPIAADLSDMRPSLAPGLLKAGQRNADRGLSDVALFEVGQVFLGDGENDQRMNACVVRRGTARPEGAGRDWRVAAKPVDVFDAKSDAMALLQALGVSLQAVQIVPGGPAFLHPGRSATLQFGPKNIVGWFGELHPKTLAALDVDGPVVGFEITLDAVPAPKQRPTKAKAKLDLSDFQPVERDFAFLVAKSVKAADLVKAAQGAERQLIADVSIFDVYEGAGVAEGHRSLGLSVTLQPRDKTLTDAEIEAVAAKIVAEVGKKTGASLR